MTPTRWLMVIGATAVVLALLAWQLARQREIARCLESGGIWDGPNARCVPDPSRTILQRDLYRT